MIKRLGLSITAAITLLPPITRVLRFMGLRDAARVASLGRPAGLSSI